MNKKPKVVLVVPNFYWVDSDANALWEYFPYNLCILAAMIEDICDVSILDAYEHNMSEDQLKKELEKLNPDVVGITVLMDQYASAGHKVAEIAKSLNKATKVIIGGVYATMNPEKAAKDENIDYVVIGEGEYVLKDLIGSFLGENDLPSIGICYRKGKEIANLGHSDYIHDLDTLPAPAYHLIEFEKYANRNPIRKSVDSPRDYPYARVLTSRGCPFNCSFCQVGSISGRTFRPRSVDGLLKEIEYLKVTYKIKSLIFDDDNLFTDKNRAKAIFKGMIEKGLDMPWVAIATAVFKLDKELIKLMRESGCEYIDVAIESGTERVLKKIINKPVDLNQAKEMVFFARENGIYVAANFIIGFPTETWDEIRQTVKFAEELDADYIKLFVAIPLPNTKLWDLSIKAKAFKKDYGDTDRVWTTGQVLETDEFSANDVTILRAYEWDRINFTDPKKLKRTADIMGISVKELNKIRKRTLADACRKIQE